VTNAWEVENEYRESLSGEDLDSYQPDNVVVHNTNPFVDPMYIPYSPPYSEKISSLAIEVVREHDLELVDTWYLLPYGVSGYIAKSFLSKPLIMRHAGSDMARLLTSPYLHALLKETIKSADMIVTTSRMKETFVDLGVRENSLYFDSSASVDLDVFNPNVKPLDMEKETGCGLDGIPVITYIGKATANKGIFELTEALRGIEDDFRLVLVTGGRQIQSLRNDVLKKGLDTKTVFLGFRPPWQIPMIMKASTCVVIPERDFPIKAHTPILPREAMSVGRCTILSEEIFGKRRYMELKDEVHTLIVDPKNILDFSAKLKRIIKEPDNAEAIGKEARKLSEKHEVFDAYLESTNNLYDDVLMSS
jgi:glycosyltransferase involved in cell wall biosynthesis